MAIDKVQPLKLEDSSTGGTELDQFPTELNPLEDHIETAGLVLDDATHRDETTRIWREGSDLKFQDTNNLAGCTLSELLAGGGGGGYTATKRGQILYSVNATTFVPANPVVDDVGNIVTDDTYEMVVEIQ